MWATRITRLLGIELPIIAGAMQWLSRAEFAAAISNAGGLGTITSASFASKEDLRAEIKKVRKLTDKPFAVNINLFPSLRPFSASDMLDVVDEEGVKIVETAGDSPENYIDRIQQGGRIHMHKCARRKDAVKAEKMGVDMLTIVGTECGGHPSFEGVATMVLLPRTIDSVSIPVAAGGGFTDGRGLMAALAMGAEGIVIGTALMATLECPIHEAFKKALVDANETDTRLLLNSVQKPVRAFNNRTAQEVLALESEGKPLEEILPKMKGERGLEAYKKGDLDGGVWACGQAAGLIHRSMPVAEYFQSIMTQAQSIRSQWAINK